MPDANAGGEYVPSRVVRRRDDVLWRHTISGAMVLPPQRDEPLVLDDIGTMIWDLLGEARDLDELTTTLSLRFAADREELEQDVMEFLVELERESVIELSNSR